jgi:hypothetical protein
MENEPPNALAEDGELLMSFFPADWRMQAQTCGALKGLRQDKSAESSLRVLLLHWGWGFSLRETLVRAQQAGLADLSEVALLKRLRKSKAWRQQLCCGLFAERRCSPVVAGTAPWRLLDGSLVREPGKTGSPWRIHYSLRWPSRECDDFKLTPVAGRGQGESLYPFPFAAGDGVLADRGYGHAEALGAGARQGAFFTVRLNPQGLRLPTPGGDLAPRVEPLQALKGAGQAAEWPVRIPLPRPAAAVGGAPVRGAQEYGGDRLGAAKAPPQSAPTGVASATRELALRAVGDGLEHLPGGGI